MKKIVLLAVLSFVSLVMAHSFPPAAKHSFDVQLPNSGGAKNANVKNTENAGAKNTKNVVAENVDLLADIKPQVSENGAVFIYTLSASVEISSVKIFLQCGSGEIYQYTIESSLDGEKWELLVDGTANSITADANGFTHTFTPRNIKIVRVNFLGDSANGVLPQGIALTKLQLFKSPRSQRIIAISGNINQRYLPTDEIIAQPNSARLPNGQEVDIAQRIELTAWRGERVNAQIIIKTLTGGKTLRGFVFAPKPIANLLAEATDKIKINANFVRNVLATPQLNDGKTNGKLARFPDILENSLKEIPTIAGETRTLWLTIDVDTNTVAGEYTGTIIVGESEQNFVAYDLKINVLNAAIPSPENWRISLDLWQTPESVAFTHNVELWSDEHFAIMLPHYRRLANAGQKNITATIIHEAWEHQAYYSQPGMVRWSKNRDGKMRYDFSLFDKWVSFMSDTIGIKGAIVCYTMIPWSLKFRYFDEALGEDVDWQLQPSDAEYENHWRDFLTTFVEHQREKGWLERTRIGIDERPEKLMAPAIALLKKYAPALKVVSATNHVAENPDDFIAELSPVLHKLDASKLAIEKRLADGLTTTYYVCCNPARPNTFTTSILAESEWLLNYAAANKFDGFLRWAYDNFNEAPLICTDYTKWMTGDCFLVYPGNRSSLRFERLRDGIENFEKINILRDAAKAQNKLSVLLPLEEFLTKTYTWERGKNADNPYAADNEQTEKLINEAAGILLQ